MKKIILFALAAITLISFCSCDARYSDTEIKAVLDELLPKSFEMNEIYFGKGLPISEDKDVLDDYYSGFDSDIEMINYHPVSRDCPYQNETELRAATLQVFTKEYSEYLFQRAFPVFLPRFKIRKDLRKHTARYTQCILKKKAC